MVIKVKNTGLFGKLYEYGDVHVMQSSHVMFDGYPCFAPKDLVFIVQKLQKAQILSQACQKV